MILAILILVLLIGALLSLISSKWSSVFPRYIALLALGIDIILLLGSWNLSAFPILFKNRFGWMLEFSMNWIPLFNANIHLAMDGLSFLMLLLTFFMAFISVLVSPKTDNEGYYYFNSLLMISGVTGIFLALDLLLFFFFWEMMLVPIYLLMVRFGRELNSKNSFKLLVYTQSSGLVLLVSIICLHYIRLQAAGWSSFDYLNLQGILMGSKVTSILMFGFLIAFFVKLPSIPFHGWFLGSFKEAPVIAISSGLLIKTGAYGIIRFALPLFHEASALYTNAFLILGVITILYGAFMAFSQEDLRMIAAYIGISHMGFIVVGLFSFNEIAWQGVVLQMIVSAISISALMFIAAALLKHTGTCNISQMGGLFEKTPVLSGLAMFFVFATLGLPGTGNFIAEFMILVGVFKTNLVIAVLASTGLVFSVVYSLRIIQKVIVGKKIIDWQLPDSSFVEKVVFGSLVLLILWIGLFPKPILIRSKPVVEKVLNILEVKYELPVHRDIEKTSINKTFK